MKKNYFTKNSRTWIVAGCLLVNGFAGAQVTQTFSFTGSMQSFTVPSCVSSITLDARGAQGANSNDKLLTNSAGGLGGRAVGVIAVTPGQVLNIFVGGPGNISGAGGYNGGGSGGMSQAGSSCFGGPAAGGGGATDVRMGGVALSNRIIVGGGGGGSGRDYCNGTCQPCGCGGSGGAGGGLSGLVGQAATNCGFSFAGSNINGGAGGSGNAGGAGGPGDGGGNPGFAGLLGVGGGGADGQFDVSGGGGGGGYYGGGGGGGASNGSGVGGGGGGGGSSYLAPAMTNTTTTSNFNTGNGIMVLSFNYDGGVVSATASPQSICTGGIINLNASSGLVSYTWSPGNIQSQNISVSPTSNTDYTVFATNSIGCISSAVVQTSVYAAAPVLTITSSTTSICPTNTVLLTASGAVNYSWTGGVTNGVPFSPGVTTNYTVTGTNPCGSANSNITITVTPLPVFSIVSPTLICANETATLNAGGANSYTWMPGNHQGASLVVSPGVSTIYTVTGSTSVCAGVSTVALAVNPIPTITATSSNSNICEGVPTTLSASGGINYTWSPSGQTGPSISVTPLVPTAYIVTGSNPFNCTSTAQQIVLVTPSPTVNIQASRTSICPGITVTLTASGANSYQWDNSQINQAITVSPSVTTVYTVTGLNTTSGCSKSQTVSINVFTVPLVLSSNTAVCIGNQVTLQASGATSYTWSNNVQGSQNVITPTVSATYMVNTITFTNTINCPSSGAISVTVNPLPNITAVATRTSLCRNETVTVTPSGGTSYLWSNQTSTPTFTLKGNVTGTFNYSVTGTDANGCSRTIGFSLRVNACTDIAERSLLKDLQVYPNPSSGSFNITFSSVPLNTTVRVYNTVGILINTLEVNSETTNLNLEKEANGIYLLDFIQNNKSIQVTKIIKQ